MSMIIHDVTQGSPEWHALRASHFTASEAPAMMGVSKYQTRTQLLQAKKTGIAPEVDPATQRLFEQGHATEALARPIVERIIGEDLYPVVGTRGNLLASLDGIDMLETVVFEHKMLNQALIEQIKAGELEPHYWAQLEQQLYVSGAERAIFACSDGTDENLHWLEYRPAPGRIEQILAGWKQFEEDLAAFEPSAPAEPAAVGRAPEHLPALHIEVTGMVKASNLQAFREHAVAVFGGISRDLQTDQDFANAESTVKWCKGVEEKLEAAKQHALSQTASIDELFRTIDEISESARATRLELDKLVKARKEARRLEIKQGAEQALAAHISAINQRLGKVQLPAIAADFAGAIKGKRTISSLQDAVDTELARAKIKASEVASGIEVNLASLRELAAEHAFLFADAQQLVLKAPDDLVATIKSRIADHQQAEQRRQDAERERIRAEEQARLQREQQEAERQAIEQQQAAARKAMRAQARAEDMGRAQPAAQPAPTEAPDIQAMRAMQQLREHGSVTGELFAGAAGDTVEIPLAEYRHLQERVRLLEALEAAGVDNWSGYDDALDMLREDAA